MTAELWGLHVAAASMGVLHTLAGPDHYLPFVALARARNWSARRALAVTAVCGLGHVAGSLLLGAVGIALGLGLGRLDRLESVRGEIAAWLLIAFGLAYGVWGLKRAMRSRRHVHEHAHVDGSLHDHGHHHHGEHAHPHLEGRRLTAWVLFVIFVFGPCEALIPFLMFPAATTGLSAALSVAAVFGIATVATMLSAVGLLLAGIGRVPGASWGRYGHAVAGLVILLCGMAIQFGL